MITLLITHDSSTTSSKHLLGFLHYIDNICNFCAHTQWSKKDPNFMLDSTNTLVRIKGSNEQTQSLMQGLSQSGIRTTNEDVLEKLLAEPDSYVVTLDSDEIPLLGTFAYIPTYMARRQTTAVPLIHMKYKQESFSATSCYNSFVDHPLLFEDALPIEIDIPHHLSSLVNDSTLSEKPPYVALSSKWVKWPNEKILFHTNINRDPRIAGNMFLSVYKIERII